MKQFLKIFYLLFVIIGILIFGCDKEETTTPTEPSWQTIFEDNFNGENLDTNNWTQVESTSLPYSLTGNGELKINGVSGVEDDGPTFVYNSDIPGNTVKVITKFRTTLDNPVDDYVDIAIVLNADISANNYYGLVLTSEPVGNTRDYGLVILKITNDSDTMLKGEYIGGTTPQITADNDYILEAVNNNGNIIFTIKDDSGNVLKSITVTDSSYSGGKVAFNVDMNGSQSIFFDYLIIQKYEWLAGFTLPHFDNLEMTLDISFMK